MADSDALPHLDRTDADAHRDGWVERPDGVRYPSPERARAFLGLLRAGAALEHALDRDLRRAHGISLRAYEVLLHLAAFAPDRCRRMTDLIAQAPLSQSRVSRLVAELEAEGLVRRDTYEPDARGVTVVLTPAGLDRLLAVQDTHHRGLEQRLFARLTDDELRVLGDLTATILEGC